MSELNEQGKADNNVTHLSALNPVGKIIVSAETKLLPLHEEEVHASKTETKGFSEINIPPKSNKNTGEVIDLINTFLPSHLTAPMIKDGSKNPQLDDRARKVTPSIKLPQSINSKFKPNRVGIFKPTKSTNSSGIKLPIQVPRKRVTENKNRSVPGRKPHFYLPRLGNLLTSPVNTGDIIPKKPFALKIPDFAKTDTLGMVTKPFAQLRSSLTLFKLFMRGLESVRAFVKRYFKVLEPITHITVVFLKYMRKIVEQINLKDKTTC